MVDKIKELMSKPIAGGVTVGILVAGIVAVMLYKRYS